MEDLWVSSFDWEGSLGHKRPTGMMSIFGAPAFHCHFVLALEGHLPGGRALGALYAEMPFLTSALMEHRVQQVRRLPMCISRVNTTHKCLSHREALAPPPRPLIFERVICYLRYVRALPFCPQHWLLCHLDLY